MLAARFLPPPTAPDSAGCRLWWVPVGGGTPSQIAAAPANADIGVAVGGTVTFAVNANVAVGDTGVPVALEQASLNGTTARALRVPAPVGASIDGISATATQVAFIETPDTIGSQATYISEIWLDSGRAAPKRIASAASAADYHNPRISYFVGLTLTGASVYAFLYAQPGSQARSQLEQVALPSLGVTSVAWHPAQALAADAVGGAAFDPTDSELVASLFPPKLSFAAGTPCSTLGGLAGACPIVPSGPVTW